uniref:Uncharacterized protein n=1 Tax=Anguilla anguilla TaxID=7936 RepID=A0A0E9UIG8_ANGAN
MLKNDVQSKYTDPYLLRCFSELRNECSSKRRAHMFYFLKLPKLTVLVSAFMAILLYAGCKLI